MSYTREISPFFIHQQVSFLMLENKIVLEIITKSVLSGGIVLNLTLELRPFGQDN